MGLIKASIFKLFKSLSQIDRKSLLSKFPEEICPLELKRSLRKSQNKRSKEHPTKWVPFDTFGSFGFIAVIIINQTRADNLVLSFTHFSSHSKSVINLLVESSRSDSVVRGPLTENFPSHYLSCVNQKAASSLNVVCTFTTIKVPLALRRKISTFITNKFTFILMLLPKLCAANGVAPEITQSYHFRPFLVAKLPGIEQ